jgi:hypothetical protein
MDVIENRNKGIQKSIPIEFEPHIITFWPSLGHRCPSSMLARAMFVDIETLTVSLILV